MHASKVSIASLSRIVDCVYTEMKNTVQSEWVAFSRIEKSTNQWLLSIVLVREFTESSINEIVVETNIDITTDFFQVRTDLSYGNGFILGEKAVVIPKNIIQDEVHINTCIRSHSYEKEDIDNAINMLLWDYGKNTNYSDWIQ